MQKVLVTGGMGYIGSHTVVELINKGYNPVIVDNLSMSEKSVLKGIKKITGIVPEFYNIDLSNKIETNKLFAKLSDIKAIIHFAAYKAVGESVQNPLMYYENNIFSLVNVLQNMKKHNIENIVFSSSCTVYGEPDSLPVSEQSPIKKAMSPYGNTKQIAEEILQDTTKANNIKTIALRYFNPIGAHPSGYIGELPVGVPNNLVPFITQTAIGKRKQLKVFGKDYNTPDGTCIRDYIYIGDLAEAHVVAIDRLLENKNKTSFETFNLGTGKGYSVKEVIDAFERNSKTKLNYKYTDRRPGDVEEIYANPKFANQELGWHAKTDIDTMMLTAWNWEVNLKKQTNREII